jgi:uncharacterized membrane protein
MSVKMENIAPRKILIWVVLLLILTNLSIIFNIPFFRQIFGFFMFSFAFGFLIMLCFRIDYLKFIKYMVYSIGISISFLILFGLLINFVLPLLGTEHPLSFQNILIFFNLAFIILWTVAFARNKDELRIFIFEKKEFQNKPHSIKRLIFLIAPILFLILAIVGSNLLDSYNLNFLQILLIFLIVVYIISLVIFSRNNSLPENVFYLAIFLITLSIIFMVSLRSEHLFGCDVHGEFFIFQLVKEQAIWQSNAYSYNSCLSVTVLPAMLSNVLGINDEHIYTIIFQILFALAPLVIYLFLRKYSSPLYAFLSAFLFISFGPFVSLSGIVRQEIAGLFFVLAVLSIFDNELKKHTRKLFFILFSTILVLSHYTIAYVYAGVLLAIIVINWLSREKDEDVDILNSHLITWVTGVLFLALIFFWYGQMTTTPFNGLVKYTQDIISNLVSPFVSDLRSEGAMSAISVPSGSLLFIFEKYLSHLMKLSMIIGLIYLFFNFKKLNIDKGFVVLSFYSMIFVVLSIFLPLVTKDLGVERIFLHSLMILCFCGVVGMKYIFEKLKLSENIRDILIASLILLFFLFQSGFVYQLTNQPSTSAFSNNALAYRMWYVHPQEIQSIQWLSNLNPEKIYADHNSLLRIWSYGKIPYPYTAGEDRRTDYLTLNTTLNSFYTYLRFDNVANKSILIKEGDNYNYVPEAINLVEKSNKIYDNGGSQIFK